MLSYLLIAYLILINIVGFTAMRLDKRRAVRKHWRIPEARLLLYAALGGSIGSLAGMYRFRHKTRKPLFFIGIPVILCVQLLIAYLLAVFVFR